jgi:hypothetical protein
MADLKTRIAFETMPLATALAQRANSLAYASAEWHAKHEDVIDRLVSKHLPSGSGLDAGITFHAAKSSAKGLHFTLPWHAMNSVGFYVGWVDYEAFVTVDFHGLDVAITTVERDTTDLDDFDVCGTLDYLADLLNDFLTIEVHNA